jgi:hypothetical protein
MKKLSFTVGLLLLVAIVCGAYLLAQSGSAKPSPFTASRAYADMKAMVDLAAPRAVQRLRKPDVHCGRVEESRVEAELDEFEAVAAGRRKMINIRAIHAGTGPRRLRFQGTTTPSFLTNSSLLEPATEHPAPHGCLKWRGSPRI